MWGIFDRKDQIQFSAEFISVINYMAEHNPIAFLIFIDRMDLVRALLGQKELHAKLRAYFDKFERRRAKLRAKKRHTRAEYDAKSIEILTKAHTARLDHIEKVHATAVKSQSSFIEAFSAYMNSKTPTPADDVSRSYKFI